MFPVSGQYLRDQNEKLRIRSRYQVIMDSHETSFRDHLSENDLINMKDHFQAQFIYQERVFIKIIPRHVFICQEPSADFLEVDFDYLNDDSTLSCLQNIGSLLQNKYMFLWNALKERYPKLQIFFEQMRTDPRINSIKLDKNVFRRFIFSHPSLGWDYQELFNQIYIDLEILEHKVASFSTKDIVEMFQWNNNVLDPNQVISLPDLTNNMSIDLSNSLRWFVQKIKDTSASDSIILTYSEGTFTFTPTNVPKEIHKYAIVPVEASTSPL